MFAIILISSMVASIAIVSNVMYLYFGAYRSINFLHFSIKSVKYNITDSYVSIETVICVENPTEFTLTIDYVEFTLWLNNDRLREREPKRMFSDPLDLQPFKNNSKMIKIDNVPSAKVVGQSPKIWLVELPLVLVRDVPFLGRVRLQNILLPEFIGD